MSAFFEMFILNWYFAGFLFGIVIVAENDAPIFAVIVGLIFAGLLVTLTGINPTPMQVAIAIALYIPFGLVYAVWKYRCEVNKAVERFNNKEIGGWQLDNLKPSNMTGEIAGWTILWIISLPFNFLSQLFSELKVFIATKLRGFLNSIYEGALSNKVTREEK